MVGIRGLTLKLLGNHAVGCGYLPGTGSQAWKMAGGRGRKMRGSTGREEAEQRMKTWEGKEGSGIREGGGSWMLKQGSKGLTSLQPSFGCVLPTFPLSPLSAPLRSKNLRLLPGAPVCNPNTGLGIPFDSCMCVYVCSESRLQ